MFLELYYEHYGQEDHYEKWADEEKVLPYLVGFPSAEDMFDFMAFLKGEGFRPVAYYAGFRGLYINMKFRTFGPIQKAVKPVCVDDRHFTPEEFLREIFYDPKHRNTDA